MTADRSAIPAELLARAQWVDWRLTDVVDKKTGEISSTKVPHHPRGWLASSTKPATWSTYKAACAAADRGQHDGIGYVFSIDDPFAGIDLDGCRNPDSGALAGWGYDIILQLHSYSEVSPSQTGVKIFVRARLPIPDGETASAGRKKNLPGAESFGPKAPAIEVYDWGRYFTITGQHIPGTPPTIKRRQHALLNLMQSWFPPEPPKDRARRVPTATVDLDDARLLQIAFNAPNGNNIRALWNGDTSRHGNDDSGADQALCNHLAWYTGGDQARMDRLFRQSGLYRDKWERDDYRQWTLDKAVASWPSFFGDSSPRLLASPRRPDGIFLPPAARPEAVPLGPTERPECVLLEEKAGP